jgi:anaerobic magnesium-protoporphyrin IX monomethyl ester cyclase
MKVLLINAPFPFEESPTPPFGLMSLAAYLEQEGIEVRIEDYIIQPYSLDRVREVMSGYAPDVVGSTAVTMNVKGALRILNDYRTVAPDVVTVMGGPHVTFDADAVLGDNAFLDFVVRREGELTFTELLRALESKSPLDGILGISYKKDGRVVHNEDRPLIPDINILPYPARHLVQLSKYKALSLPINLVTSRGCPNKCIFCVGSRMVGRKVRYFDVKRVVDEFELLSKMGFNQINVVDDLFTANKRRCMEICDEILRRGIKHKWVAFARVDTVSKDLMLKLKEAGCATLCFGIESGNQEILDRVKKNITLAKCQAAVDLCNEVGIEPMTSYILGLPGETPETVRQTMEFARKLSPLYGFHILSPFPGTEVRDKSEEYGMRILSSDWDRYDANQSVAESITMPHEEIDRLVNEFNGGIIHYIKELGAELKAGREISEKDRAMLGGVITFDFNRQLVLGELVEHFPGAKNGGGSEQVRREFREYIQQYITYSPEDTVREIDRLFRINCLKSCSQGGRESICWA